MKSGLLQYKYRFNRHVLMLHIHKKRKMPIFSHNSTKANVWDVIEIEWSHKVGLWNIAPAVWLILGLFTTCTWEVCIIIKRKCIARSSIFRFRPFKTNKEDWKISKEITRILFLISNNLTPVYKLMSPSSHEFIHIIWL